MRIDGWFYWTIDIDTTTVDELSGSLISCDMLFRDSWVPSDVSFTAVSRGILAVVVVLLFASSDAAFGGEFLFIVVHICPLPFAVHQKPPLAANSCLMLLIPLLSTQLLQVPLFFHAHLVGSAVILKTVALSNASVALSHLHMYEYLRCSWV